MTAHLDDYLDRIPDATHFPTLPEIEERLRLIHAEHPATTSVEVIGKSRAGRPLTMLTVGLAVRPTAGADVVPPDRHAVVTGMPHPNEPTGTLAALALGELLAGDEALLRELGLIWHLVPCVDPDGAALNEGWFHGPFTRQHYAEHIYRPPFPEQYEWTFHRPDLDPPGLAPIPESTAVAAVIDAVRPALLVTMHNGEAGGLFAYVSRAVAGLAETLQQAGAASGLPIFVGAPEGEVEVLGPGLFHFIDQTGEMVSSTGYAEQHGTLGLVIEPPMWVDESTSDDSPSDLTYRRAHARGTAARAGLAARMTGWLDRVRPHLDLDTARGRAVEEQLHSLLGPGGGEEVGEPDSAADQVCTVAYARSLAEEVLLERLRATGHLVAYLREEQATADADVTRVLTEALDALTTWAAEEPEPAFVALGPAVRAHVALTLSTARLLKDER